jgi:hypothetical protein
MTNARMKQHLAVIKIAASWKRKIIEKGMLRARCKCPFCDKGYWHGVVEAPKQTSPYRKLNMYCDGCYVKVEE